MRSLKSLPTLYNLSLFLCIKVGLIIFGNRMFGSEVHDVVEV